MAGSQLADDRGSRVSGMVVNHQNTQPAGRIILFDQRAQADTNVGLFVACGNNDRNRRRRCRWRRTREMGEKASLPHRTQNQPANNREPDAGKKKNHSVTDENAPSCT